MRNRAAVVLAGACLVMLAYGFLYVLFSIGG